MFVPNPVAVQVARVPVPTNLNPKSRVVLAEVASTHGFDLVDYVRFVSQDGNVSMTVEVKETHERLIVTRRIRLGNKKIKKLEVFDKN
jgi:hypothetical protein